MKCCPIETLGMSPPAKKYDTRWKMRARAITCPPKEIRLGNPRSRKRLFESDLDISSSLADAETKVNSQTKKIYI